ncbi:hybrid sensor histidine kinase/response regulator [Pseudomonas sp. LS44]|uniref:hybrid sensor histidine kinase/response regulator n=1 Tax=Pseudomonas sp. LS44 TaxID=1357074 RepID=UPI00215B504B|nr:hybrid sensor histidine kinase/response regulator [Pseudomonas sp. LS44]UVE18953.1 hybrid sensor histidine kinase/response regulator [Pseudomonas sp. LS44]
MQTLNQRTYLVDLLFRQSYAVLFANFVIPIPVAYILRNSLSLNGLLVWIIVMYILTVGRILLARRYFEHGKDSTTPLRWAWWVTVLSWLSSLLWGWLGWVGFAAGDPQLLAFTCIVLTGLVCGAMPSLSAFPPAYIGSLAAMLLPVTVHCLSRQGEVFATYTFFLICLAGVNLYYSRVTYRSICETARLRLENVELVGRLEEERDRAQAADQAKSRFLAAASHDLRQPIHALSLFVGALVALAERGDVQATKAREIAARLRTVIGNLGGLLNGLLDISQLDAGVVTVSREPVSLERLFSDLHHEFAGTAQERHLSWRVRQTELWVDSDPVLLKRTLDNLLANAFRYTTQGSVLLGCRRRGQTVEIQVIDSGPGIPADQQAAIFDEFVQLHNAERDRTQGLGLGLAIVRHTSRLLGHTVRLVSVEGCGSMFSISAPTVAAPSIAPLTEPWPTDEQALGIMIVDDEQDVLDALCALLEAWGHRIYAGLTAQQACQQHAEAARSGPASVQLILSDYRLSGGMTGHEAIRRIRDYLRHRVPAILITGDTSPAYIKEASASGHRLLHKPLDAQVLREVIEASRP